MVDRDCLGARVRVLASASRPSPEKLECPLFPSSIPTLDDSRLKFALESKLLQWEILTSAGDEQAKRIAGLEAVLGTENSVLRECLFLGLARAYLVRRRYQESLDMVRRLEFDSIELRGIRMTAEYFLKHQSRRQRGAAEGEGNTEKQSKAPATK
jgi:hypothetical protein